MIRRALIVDTETTGSDPRHDQVIELGLILYSVTAQSTLFQFSALLPATKPNTAEFINAISNNAIAEAAAVEFDAISIALNLFNLADVIVGHNCLDFDRVFLGEPWTTKPWICTKTDFAWPRGKANDSLVNIALAHGIGVSSAHRALIDCQLIAALFDRMHLFHVDLQELFAKALRPKFTWQAWITYEERQLAKDAGFTWMPEKKIWIRRMTQEDADRLPFLVKKVDEVNA